MNTMKKNMIRIILGIIIMACCVILCILNAFNHKGIIIKDFNNYYDENDIVLFYDNNLDSKIKVLNDKYKLTEKENNKKDEITKVLDICKLTSQIMEYDDVDNTNADNAYDILTKKAKEKSHKVSRKDYAVITRDMLVAGGMKARVGYFRSADSQFRDKTIYYIVEFWSKEYSKWIAIDCFDGGYFMNGDLKLSALEILNDGIRNVAYLGNSSQKDYKNKIKKYLDSYTIEIDNTSAHNKSNSYICYVKDDKALEIKWSKSYAPPTIFTKSSSLFEKSPFNDEISKDEKAYLILVLSDVKDNNKDKDEKSTALTIAGFQNGGVMNSYYLNINNSGYKEINKYDQIKLDKGITSIKLSVDGKTEASSVTIDREK